LADLRTLDILGFSPDELMEAKMRILSIRVIANNNHKFKKGKICADGSLEFEN
jgi:hypothetical protein